MLFHLLILLRSTKLKNMDWYQVTRPTVEYATIVWGPHYTTQVNNIEQVQRRAARFVDNNYSWKEGSPTEIMERYNWQSLQKRRADTRVIFMYKIVHGLVAIPWQHYFVPVAVTHLHGTRHNIDLTFNQYQSRTLYFNQSFFPRVVPEWNCLPQAARCASSVGVFRTHLSGWTI